MKLKLIFIFALYSSNLAALDVIKVSGKITSSRGQGLLGANILVVGTSIGAATDLNGKYSIDLLKKSFPDGIVVIKASYIGYQSKLDTINLNELKDSDYKFDLKLAADVMQLESVVVTGVGMEQETKKLGVSIEKVRKEKIENSPEVSLVSALRGMYPASRCEKQAEMRERMHFLESVELALFLEDMSPWLLLMEARSVHEPLTPEAGKQAREGIRNHQVGWQILIWMT